MHGGPGVMPVKTVKPYVITLALPWREPVAQEGTDSETELQFSCCVEVHTCDNRNTSEGESNFS